MSIRLKNYLISVLIASITIFLLWFINTHATNFWKPLIKDLFIIGIPILGFWRQKLVSVIFSVTTFFSLFLIENYSTGITNFFLKLSLIIVIISSVIVYAVRNDSRCVEGDSRR
jgi:K+-sensing histidine kinase KdpD